MSHTSPTIVVRGCHVTVTLKHFINKTHQNISFHDSYPDQQLSDGKIPQGSRQVERSPGVSRTDGGVDLLLLHLLLLRLEVLSLGLLQQQ